MRDPYVYILVIALTTYLLRVLPLTLIRKPITSPLIRSFLYYVPYVTLAVMVFPAILTATGSLLAGIVAMAVAVGLALAGQGLVTVAACACLAAFLIGLIL